MTRPPSPSPQSPARPPGPAPLQYVAPRLGGKRSLESITLSAPLGTGNPADGTGRFGHP